MAKKAVLTEYQLDCAHLKRPLTIAHVSDLHERDASDILALAETVRPDLIAVTGDSFERFQTGERKPRHQKKSGVLRTLVLTLASFADSLFAFLPRRADERQTENVRRFLEGASALAPVFLSLGNHEVQLNEEDTAMLERYGVTLLDNAGTTAEIGGCALRIGGLSTDADEEWLRGFVRESGFKLLLCHHPEYYDDVPGVREADVVLAGHNHGGQIKLFGKGLFSSRGGILPKYDSGVFDGRMVVSAGCANTFRMPRFGNPRELVVVRLKPLSKPLKNR